MFFLFGAAVWGLLPLLVRQELGLGPQAFGLMLGAMGAGAVTAGFLMPSLRGRMNRSQIVWAASALSAFACAVLVLPFAQPTSVKAGEFAWLAVFGSVQFGLGLLLLTLGSRLLDASRAALLGNIELPLAPLWVWLAFGQSPGLATWVGGGIVMLALAFDMATSQRGEA